MQYTSMHPRDVMKAYKEIEMIELKDYTIRLIKMDKRYKISEVFAGDYDYQQKEHKWMLEEMKELARLYPPKKYRIELHETYVTKTNLLSGKEYQERFDTPHYCSPSSESYWSM